MEKERGEALAVLQQLGIDPTPTAITLTEKWIRVLRDALVIRANL